MVDNLSNTKNDVLVLWLLGMHRSGTSLTANWLHHCGLNLGSSFIQADVGNIRGYYEDSEIVNFHKQIIRDNSYGNDIQIGKRLEFNDAHFNQAKMIFRKKSSSENIIVWKDPRTCLTIDLWNKVIPDNKAIVLFRDFSEVVDSLVRRKAKAEKKRRNFVSGYFNYLTRSKYSKIAYTDSLLKSWILHNRQIIDYLNKSSKESHLIIKADQLQKYSEEIFGFIKGKFDLKLEYYPFDKIFDKNLMSREVPQYSYSRELLDEANDVLSKLENLKTIKSN